jgi:hypothetical protein
MGTKKYSKVESSIIGATLLTVQEFYSMKTILGVIFIDLQNSSNLDADLVFLSSQLGSG